MTTRSLILVLACLGLTAFVCAQDSRPTESAPAAEAPPIPTPKFASADNQALFDEVLELLENGDHKTATKQLKKIKGLASDEEREAVDRAKKEAKGLKEIVDIDKLTSKGRARKALAKLDKLLPNYVGTNAGVAMAERRKDVFEQVFYLVADFEEAKSAGGSDEGGGGQGGGRNRGGNTGYGQNTSLITGTPKTGEVREGTKALKWRTTAGLTYIEFGNVEAIPGEYTYLCLSIRSENPKSLPNVIFLFDCEEGAIRGGGPGGMGGRRGAAGVYNREGFSMTQGTKGKWQDLRLPLKKFNKRGDITWDDVLTLKVVHVPGAEGRLVIDNVRLEKE